MKHFARRLKASDNINTDYVISGRYKFKIQDPKELAKHIFEDLDPDFAVRVKEGDILVDDRVDNCARWEEAGGVAIQVTEDYELALKQLEALIESRIQFGTR